MHVYTKQRYEYSKYNDLLPLKCDLCGKIFYRKKREIYILIYSKQDKTYCSKECACNSLKKHTTTKCLQCGKDVYNKKFCTTSCSTTYWNKHRKPITFRTTKTRIIKCMRCNKEVTINAQASKIICETCKELSRVKKCTICGENNCKRKICKSIKNPIFQNKLINHFGLPVECIGTSKIFNELEKIKNILYDKYIIHKDSNTMLAEEYMLNSAANIKDLLVFFDIPRRSISQGLRAAFKSGRAKICNAKNRYHAGWHTTWDGKRVFLRSSYELAYAKKLDKQKTLYEVEYLRIPYICSLGYEKTYIPDFYLPQSNKIIEIKSTYTYGLDKNINLKIEESKRLGYLFELIVLKNIKEL